ncbi:DNA binding domain%2C excisionase family [uncultured Flavonifractor sp.]|nr:DNA binding domain%2C excisionase family [uncultured Flavonifractor sp.]
MVPNCICSIEQLPLILRVDDLISILKIGRNAAYALVRSGQLKALRIGNSYRIPRSELARFLGEST